MSMNISVVFCHMKTAQVMREIMCNLKVNDILYIVCVVQCYM